MSLEDRPSVYHFRLADDNHQTLHYRAQHYRSNYHHTKGLSIYAVHTDGRRGSSARSGCLWTEGGG